MDQVVETGAPGPTAEAPPSLSLFERLVAVYARPTQAWGGLSARAQWWFPLLIVIAFAVAGNALIYHRATVPMMVDQWDQAVQNGTMNADKVEQMQTFAASPMGLLLFSIVPILIFVPLVTLFVALVIWFGAGFVLGTRFSYRLALETAAWSALVGIPGQLLTYALGWSRQTLRGVHIGFGALLPDMETPSKLMTSLAGFLDGLGPFAIWSMVVTIIGAAALSGAPRKQVAWVLGGLYVAILALFCALGALFGPGT